MFDGAWPTILHRVVTEFDRWGVGCPHVSATCNRSGAVHGSDHVGWTSSSTGGLGSQGQCRPGFKAWAHDGSCKSGSPTQRGARKVGCNPHPSVVPAVPVFGSFFLFLWLYWMIGSRWQIEIVWVGRQLWDVLGHIKAIHIVSRYFSIIISIIFRLVQESLNIKG